jgi:hypothetical protein
MLDTNIGDDGTAAIASALKNNTTLASIDLCGVYGNCCLYNADCCTLGTSVGDDGAKAIADALESNTTLTSIHLGSKCFECRICAHRWLMHVSRESLDRFRWWQSDWNGIAAQHNVDIDRASLYVFVSVLSWIY